MGKIVKFCSACEEGFAEKFGFCPNCGSSLTAFELNPLNEEAVFEEPEADILEIDTPSFDSPEVSPTVESFPVPENFAFSAEEQTKAVEEPAFENVAEFGETRDVEYVLNQEETGEPREEVIEEETEEYAIPAASAFGAAAGNGNYQTSSNQAAYNFHSSASDLTDDDFQVTFVQEKNAKQRNLLLLGSSVFVLSTVFIAVIYSLFIHNLDVGEIPNPELIAFLPSDAPMEIENEPIKKKNDNDEGGGGGGGKENPEPATKGRLPNQVDKPIMPPMPVQPISNPDLAVLNETQGKNKRDRTNERVGLLNGIEADFGSSGPGSGGGIGTGRGTGVGSGIGTGEGSGIGSGSGGGRGNGNGDGRGDGGEPPVIKVGPTVGLKILAKPRPNYTDPARQNQVQGTVRLRVTFLASGQIGSIAPVSGLPYGLTEQAIAAARNIRFEPAKKNGQPYTVTKQVEYSFTIY